MRYKVSLSILIIFTAIAVFSNPVITGNDILDKITKMLNRWSSAMPMEKVYLQLDNTHYSGGDDIWFKAYITSGAEHQLSDLSVILVTELINEHGFIVQRKLSHVKMGLAWGNFTIPDVLQAGDYHIRAYTNNMRNAGEEYFFNKHISIRSTINDDVYIQSKLTHSEQATRKVNDADVQFFPEGGNLVEGINSRVAFKAVTNDGLGTDITGTIVDDKNNAIMNFASRHLGMGSFTFKPLPAVTYKAKVIFSDGSEKIIPLPSVKDDGYVLSINRQNPDQVEIAISASRKAFLENLHDTLTLVAQAGGHIYYAAKCAGGSKYFKTNVPGNRFPAGVVQFTLFSRQGEPLNERLVFIRNNDDLHLNIRSDKQNYQPQEKVNVRLNVLDHSGEPVFGSFSATVIREDAPAKSDTSGNNILSDLLLTSDLQGYIQNPAYYFSNTNSSTLADLDVLMLTQGYHRFEWRQLLERKFPEVIFQPERTLDIEGHVTLRGKPVSGCKVSLLSTRGAIFSVDTVTDERGRFKFTNSVVSDSMMCVIKDFAGKDQVGLKVTIDDKYQQTATFDKNLPDANYNFNSLFTDAKNPGSAFQNNQPGRGLLSKTTHLKEVTIKGDKILVTHSSNLNGPGNADQVLITGQIPLGFSTIDGALQGRLVGISIKNGHFYSNRGGSMSVCLDGIIIPDNEVQAINAYDVQSIEVLRSITKFAAYGQKAGPGGVIIITSKNPNEYPKAMAYQKSPATLTYFPPGYSKVKEFYQPKYSLEANSEIANSQKCLFWKPDIFTDKDGNASFDFFNFGAKGSYKIIIEGIDVNGHLGRQVYSYKVN